jgi:hypothetical protein
VAFGRRAPTPVRPQSDLPPGGLAQTLNSSGRSRRASDSAISRSPSAWVLRSRTRLFDVIGVDHHRNSKVEDHRYAETIRRYLGQGKPVVNSEFGHSPYREDRPGHMELGEVDTLSVALHRIPVS